MEKPAVTLTLRDRIAIITLDDPASPVNTWNEAIGLGFYDVLNDCKDKIDSSQIDGVIIMSGKEKNFHAGADLKNGGKVETTFDKLKKFEFFQATMNRIERLKVPTLAAIRGHALGGGLELALACDYRIAQEHEKTILGLPEVTLGLIPCYGGTQRLPRLLGPASVPLIMEGTKISASSALSTGLIDSLVPLDQNLQDEAVTFLKNILSGNVAISRTAPVYSDMEKAIRDECKVLEMDHGSLSKSEKCISDILLCSLKEEDSFEGFELEKRYIISLAMSRAAQNDPR